MQAAELAARVRTVAALADIVQAMRTIASARRRRAEERFSGLERYAAGTRALLLEALALAGEAGGALSEAPARPRRVLVLFSEHGFVGALNERLLECALAVRREGDELVAVGARGRRLCHERCVSALEGGGMPAGDGAVSATAERLVADAFASLLERRVGAIYIVFAEHRPPLGWSPRALRLFPPELPPSVGPTHGAPIHTLPPRELVERAVEEYVFAEVSFAVGEAFASEQAARFVAMDDARRHIEDKRRELAAIERQLRQEAITSEILEIAAGAEAIGGLD